MDKKVSDVIITLSSLYELLLNIGNSFDIQKNAETFLKAIMAQKNLSFAAYFRLESSNIMRKVHSIPKTKAEFYDANSELVQNVIFNKFYIINASHPQFHCFSDFTKLPQNEFAVYFTGLKSSIILAKKNGSFHIQDLTKYEIVLIKFGLFMESLESHNRIKDEIKIKEEQAVIIKQNNEKLKKQNEDLVKYIQSNTELEQFAYRVSHDLNSPLRSIISFSKLLARKSEGKFSEEQNTFLKFIVDGGMQMKELIAGILDYSKITGATLKLKRINLYQLIESIRNLLYHSLNETNGKIIVTNLPEFIVADNTKVTQLFLNLISNALKFKKENIPPEIVINGKQNEHDFTFSISDNGIGIPVKSQENIFELFSKAQNNRGSEGHGIGLNTCLQIVEQHEGKIWLKSEPKKGSTFHFSLPIMELPT